MVHIAKRNSDRCPTHPGALLREDVIPATGRTKAEIAQLLGISRQHLYDILRERKPVSPAVAVRLGKLFGDGAGVWVRMQAAYDTWNAERKEDVSKIPTLPRQSGVDLAIASWKKASFLTDNSRRSKYPFRAVSRSASFSMGRPDRDRPATSRPYFVQP
jgi:addiction module HigA family antidote